jgi:hypothetical protein
VTFGSGEGFAKRQDYKLKPIKCLSFSFWQDICQDYGNIVTSDWWSKWLRCRLHLRFKCAVLVCRERSAALTCVFDVQQNVPRSYLLYATLHGTPCSMQGCICVINVRFQCAISMCIQSARPKRPLCCT